MHITNTWNIRGKWGKGYQIKITNLELLQDKRKIKYRAMKY
jgi:hypothetical protein